jgi:hypothetical protein
MSHPYKKANDRSFWKRSVSNSFDTRKLVPDDITLISAGESVMSAGSCFAANIVPFLERSGINYVRTESPHPIFSNVHNESLSYHKFSAAYGNIYTTRHLAQLIDRGLGKFKPLEDRWYEKDFVIDPFRPGLAFPASSDFEFDILTNQHLQSVLHAIEQSDVFIFTLGLTETWLSKKDGAVFPACPGTVKGNYDEKLHEFENFSVMSVVKDAVHALSSIRKINSNIRFILTVSPVPLVATATGEHVLNASTYSKAVLRAAAQELTQLVPDTQYFPAFEIVTGPQAPESYFQDDRREPSSEAIDMVMATLLSKCDVSSNQHEKVDFGFSYQESINLADAISDYDCEEAASGC